MDVVAEQESFGSLKWTLRRKHRVHSHSITQLHSRDQLPQRRLTYIDTTSGDLLSDPAFILSAVNGIGIPAEDTFVFAEVKRLTNGLIERLETEEADPVFPGSAVEIEID